MLKKCACYRLTRVPAIALVSELFGMAAYGASRSVLRSNPCRYREAGACAITWRRAGRGYARRLVQAAARETLERYGGQA